MKRIIPVFIAGVVLASSAGAASNSVNHTALNVKPAAPATVSNLTIDNNGGLDIVTSDEDAVSISKDIKIISKTEHQADDKLSCNIDINYPQIQGAALSAGAKQFNEMIEKLVAAEVEQFKKNVAIDMPHMQTLPESIRQNSLKVDYDIDLVKPKNQTLISVRISIEGMQAGRAHPYHNNRVVNFDLTTGKVISLNDLFRPNSPYLKLLAEYTKKSLNQKLRQDSWMVTQGTKPDPKNFKNWNLQADSILITFDEYQVAPYVYGAQEVEIPYSALQKVLSTKAPIADCAKDSKNCEVG